MPLNVSYKNRIGYYTQTQTYDGKEHKYKVWFCHANCLCALMNFYKNENGVDMAQLVGFFGDTVHFRRCVKDGYFTDYGKCSNFHFYAKELNSDLWKMIRILVESGVKVTIE